MSMLNLSKYRHTIVGCSAIATVACAGLLHSGSASAQTATPTNVSNTGGANVTTIPSVSVVTGGGGGSNPGGGPSGAISGRAGAISSRVSVAQTNYDTAVSNLSAAETAQPVAANTTPVRYAVDKGVADLASCGCPNADTVSSAPTTPRPELVAAKAAEADAAAELAAAQAEARQFIESVKNGTTATSSPTTSQLW
jgi:hypothetical protein